MHRILLFACASLALAGCGGTDADQDGDGKISVEEAATQAKEMTRPEPGKYRATVEMIDVEVPGAPKEMQDAMKRMMSSGPQTHEYCLTEEEAAKGFEEMARQAQDDGSCSFEKFDAAGGKIDAVMNCAREGRGSARMTMQGTGGRTSSEMTMTMDAKAPDGKTMKMTMKSSQERVGECDG